MRTLRARQNKERTRQQNKKSWSRLRCEVLQHYSRLDAPECRCCHESTFEFLHLDHSLERLEQSKIALGKLPPKIPTGLEHTLEKEYKAKYEHVSYGGTPTATFALGEWKPVTMLPLGYTSDYLETTTEPSPARPPMTIPITYFPEDLINALMQECWKEGNTAQELLLGFAHGLMSHIEVTYDGDFRLRIKE